MKRRCAFSMCVVLLVGLMAIAVNADGGSDEAIKLTDCPKAVQKTLKRESRGGKIVEIEKEEEDGKTTHEAEVMIDGKEYEVEIAECGTLLSKVLVDEEADDEKGTNPLVDAVDYFPPGPEFRLSERSAARGEAKSASADARPQPGQGRGYRWRGGRGPGHGGGPGQGGGFGRGRGGQGHGRGMGADPEFQKDRDMFHFLLANRDSIDRKVKKLKDGIETLTESDDPKVASVIQNHVESMYKRVENGNPIHMRDPLFAAIFSNASKISMKVEQTKKGVRVIETSIDPHVVKLIQAHADVLDLFIANGHAEVQKNHAVPKRF